MHATSPEREGTARLLASILDASDAAGAAWGWTDDLAPDRIVPLAAVGAARGGRWELRRVGTFAKLIEKRAGLSWYIAVRGLDETRPEGVSSAVEQAAERLRSRTGRDGPRIPEQGSHGPEGRLVGLLDAYRLVGFDTGAPSHARFFRSELERSAASCRATVAPPALAVARAFEDHDGLVSALLGLGAVLEAEGMLECAVGVYVITYELALLRFDVQTGIDAARYAGRAYRKLTHWEQAADWYGLARRIAEHEGDLVSVARVLDGLGNTYRDRGAYPKARECYQTAWRTAQSAGDPVEIGNVALGLMNVERKAGRLDTAADYGWKALCAQSDPRERSHLLLNVGTLLLEGGDLDAAEQAYRVAQASDQDRDLVLMARDALAYCAALRGNRVAYERLRPRAARAAPYLRVQIGYFRGAALQTLGDARASRVLRAVTRYARTHGLAEWEIKATQLLERALPPSVRAIETPAEVRQGLQELCTPLP